MTMPNTEQRKILERRYLLYKRLAADPDWQSIVVDGLIKQMRADAERDETKLIDDVRRCLRRGEPVDWLAVAGKWAAHLAGADQAAELAAHFSSVVAAWESRLEREAAEKKRPAGSQPPAQS